MAVADEVVVEDAVLVAVALRVRERVPLDEGVDEVLPELDAEPEGVGVVLAENEPVADSVEEAVADPLVEAEGEVVEDPD